jgi:hypothetical protein
MKTTPKKELRQTTENALIDLFAQHEIASPSKRTKRLLTKASKRISEQLKEEIKKKFKKSEKAGKKAKTEVKTEVA